MKHSCQSLMLRHIVPVAPSHFFCTDIYTSEDDINHTPSYEYCTNKKTPTMISLLLHVSQRIPKPAECGESC